MRKLLGFQNSFMSKMFPNLKFCFEMNQFIVADVKLDKK